MRIDGKDVIVAEYSFCSFAVNRFQWDSRRRGPIPDSILYRTTKVIGAADKDDSNINRVLEHRVPVRTMTDAMKTKSN